MTTCVQRAYAKLNLSLHITGRREDGYHYISSVMQTVALHDTLTLRKGQSGLSARCRGMELPGDQRNLAVAAAYAFFNAAGLQPKPLVIEIEKRIPAGAGLGGGSADAAAALRLLNREFKAGFSAEKLRELALSIGSDVPFCVEGGTALVEGVGEKVTPLAALPPLPVLLVTPNLQVCTAEGYAALDGKMGDNFSPPSPPLDPPDRFFASAHNDFQIHLCPPQTLQALELMKSCSPLLTAMSGSGPTAFAVFNCRKSALCCALQLHRAGFSPLLTRLQRP